jgi:hypothetical protein
MKIGPEDMKELFRLELYQAERIGLLFDSIDGKACCNYHRRIDDAAHEAGVNVADSLWVLAHLFLHIENDVPPEERPFILRDLIALIDLARDKMAHWKESRI